MTTQNLKVKKNIILHPLSTDIRQIMHNTIKNYASQLEKESKLTRIQKLNVLYWKVGEILYSKKNLNSNTLEKTAQYLNDLLPNIPQFSAEQLLEIQRFYQIYHNHPYLVNKD